MLTMNRPVLLLLLPLSLWTTIHAADEVLSVHGSGTSNPGHCFGMVMEEMQARSKLPLRLTYRSVGSSIGLTEFINDFDPAKSAFDFGSSEIPVSTDEWQKFKDENVTILQLPALFGAVSFYHSIPEIPNLNLTSCLLARIFTRDIKDWAHPDIRELNPALTEMFERKSAGGDSLGASMRIRVARREEGASNTFSATSYLHQACPQHFPESMVASLPEWPVDTESCRGTLGMNECIQSRSGTIGYNEVGIANFYGLNEISIKNKYGRLLTSKEAAANGGIGAMNPGILPDDPAGDFADVSLLDQDGEYTWPIILLTYVHVRADLSFMDDPREAGLLVAFLKRLYDPAYVARCEEEMGFTLATRIALDVAQKGIELLESRLGPYVPTWEEETKAVEFKGAGDYVLSSNRRNYPALERLDNGKHIQELKSTVSDLEAQVLNLTAALLEATASLEEVGGVEFTEKYEAMILSALVLGALSTVLVLLLVALQFASRRQPAAVEAEEGEAKA